MLTSGDMDIIANYFKKDLKSAQALLRFLVDQGVALFVYDDKGNP